MKNPFRGWKFPENKIAQFLICCFAEFVSFFIIVANTRAIAQGNYLWTAVTDTFFSTQGFVMAKLMIDDKNARSWACGAGYIFGGTLGSLFAIWCTKHLYGA